MTGSGTPDPKSTIRSDEKTDCSPSSLGVVSVFVTRELRTIRRTKIYLLLIGVIAIIILGLVIISSGLSSGYAPVVVDLLTPMEFLVPVVAVAFGYKAILGDSQRGELEILQTYPVKPWQQVLGVFVGRAMGVAISTLGPLILLGVALTLSADRIWVYATPTGVDSPILFIRFGILTLLFSLVLLSMALGISAIATTGRSGLILGAIFLVVVIVGGDIGVITGLSQGWISETFVVYANSLNPNGAYRGLVLETVIGTTTSTSAAVPIANLIGLLTWGVTGVLVAILALRYRYPCR